MALLNDDDEQIMKTLLELTVKWASERPQAAREGISGIVPPMLAFARMAPDIQQGTSDVPESKMVELCETLVKDIEADEYERATTRIRSFLDGPAPKSTSDDEPQQESPSQ